MIAKVQLSLGTTTPHRQVLVTDEHGFWWEGDASPEVMVAMGEESKAFFEVKIEGNVIALMERAPWQDW